MPDGVQSIAELAVFLGALVDFENGGTEATLLGVLGSLYSVVNCVVPQFLLSCVPLACEHALGFVIRKLIGARRG